MTQNEIDFLLGIEARDGKWVPATIVQEARDLACPIHSRFEWDDGKAAQRDRERTASRLINQLPRIQSVARDGRIVAAPLAIRDPRSSATEKAYVRTASLKSEADLSRETMLRLIQRVVNALNTCQSVATALGMEDSVGAVKASVASLLRELDEPAPSMNEAA